MAGKYGIGYQGSKSRIAERLLDLMPSGRRFVDLCAGGCAMTHCAILSGRYDRFLMLDLSNSPRLFLDAVEGRLADRLAHPEWVSHEDFGRLAPYDPLTRLCWSFSNSQRSYCYGRAIEPYKHACHLAVVNDRWDDLTEYLPADIIAEMRGAMTGITDWRERRRLFSACLRRRGMPKVQVNHLEQLDRLAHVASLKQCELLQHLERLDRVCAIGTPSVDLTFEQESYEKYHHEAGDVVYADPPYNGTVNEYGMGFDSEKFHDWLRTRDYPVYVSEYNMPDDFVPLASIEVYIGYAGKQKKRGECTRTEKLWVHEKWQDEARPFELIPWR